MFPILYELLAKDAPASVKGCIADNLFSFLAAEKDLRLALAWVDAGHIQSEKGDDLYKLTNTHKLKIVKVCHKSKALSADEKKQLLEKVLVDDKSDLARHCRLTCFATEPANKEQVWKDLLDPKSDYSLYDRRALMEGFYAWDYMAECEPFFDRFFTEINNVSAQHTHKNLESWFFSLLPRMKIEDSHIVKLLQLKARVADNNAKLSNMLQDGIEIMVRSKTIREIA